MGKTSKYDKKYEVGHLFGNWKLLDNISKRIETPNSNTKDRQRLKYLCLCILCEEEKLVDCYQLENGVTKRCFKCSMKNTDKNKNPNWRGFGEISSSYFTHIKTGARLRNIDFNISIQDCDDKWKEQKGICALTGTTMTIENGSIDRIDSKKSYCKENIQWILKDLNIMKNKFDEKYFISMCKLVTEYSTKKEEQTGGACVIT